MPNRWLIVVSLGAHFAAAAALVATSVWKIERLEARPPRLDLAVQTLPAAAASELKGHAPKDPIKPKEQRKVAKDTTQPTEARKDQPASRDPVGPPSDALTAGPESPATCVENCAGTEAAPAAPVCGNNSLELGEQCDDGNAVAGDGCSATCRLEPKPRPAPATIMPQALRELRIQGDTQIQPSASTQSRMSRDGASRVTATIRVCISTTGSVASTSLQTSTRYGEYDAALLAGVRSWRYRPYLLNNVAMPACSLVTFVYSLNGR